MRGIPGVAVALAAALAAGCPERSRPDLSVAGIRPSYDPLTGKLRALTLDSDHNGRVDTWTDMDGSRPIQTRIDRNEDGRIDRWEYYDAAGALLKVGLSQKDDGKPDAWAYAGKDGAIARMEISAASDEKKITRLEHYTGGQLAAAEEDTNGDGAMDKWETWAGGAVATAVFDEDFDGRPDRRLSYRGTTLVTIESAPDGAGGYGQRVEVR